MSTPYEALMKDARITFDARDKLIVALDYNTVDEAVRLVEKLGDTVGFYKVGWQLFMGSHFQMVDYLIAAGKEVFLDLKITDIPATIQKSLINFPSNLTTIKFFTYSGSPNVIRAIKDLYSDTYTNFLNVPALSSDGGNIDDTILRKGAKALEAGADGLIVSGKAIKAVRGQLGAGFYIVAPGIRPYGADINDHKRTLTPYKAIKHGADYLVVGRPITEADDPIQVATDIIDDIESALG